MASDFLYCVKCAQQNPSNNSVCSKCGAPLVRPGNDPGKPQGNAYSPQSSAMYGSGKGKTKIVAGILAILLGSLGIHHFYLGSPVSGIVYLLVTLFTCGTAAALVGVLALVEGIMLLVMSDEEFDQRYNFGTPKSFELVFMKS